MLKQVKIRKHEQTEIVLFAIAMVLLIISLQVDGNAVGILQGMATGSISGLVLLIVSGIKNWELRELSEQYDAIHEFNCIILKTNVACNQFLHQLNYSNTDNLSFGEYQMMFREAYDKVADDFSPMSKVKFQVIHSENNKNEMMEYKQYIDLKMAEAFITLTMTTAMERKQLEQVAERFNEISGKGFWFYLKNMELENTLLAKRERLINSMI